VGVRCGDKRIAKLIAAFCGEVEVVIGRVLTFQVDCVEHYEVGSG
jgi:hypothetical protein